VSMGLREHELTHGRNHPQHLSAWTSAAIPFDAIPSFSRNFILARMASDRLPPIALRSSSALEIATAQRTQ
jgi:hypothetical protein